MIEKSGGEIILSCDFCMNGELRFNARATKGRTEAISIAREKNWKCDPVGADYVLRCPICVNPDAVPEAQQRLQLK